MHRRDTCRSGFTLIEVAVVLVIIGVIIGGVIVTQSMIRDAQLRNAVSEMQRYVQVIGNFRDKYQALPGDFGGATALWGAAHATPATCATTIGTGITTCNGNGNGRIGDQIPPSDPSPAATKYEEFRAWQHLANAGMITASITGVAYGSSPATDYRYRFPGLNIPASSLDGAGWGLTSVFPGDAPIGTELPYFMGDLPPNHVLWLGGKSLTNLGSFTINRQKPVLWAMDAKLIDTKIDDGYPSLGKVVAQRNSSSPHCALPVPPSATSTYNIAAAQSLICALVFKTGF